MKQSSVLWTYLAHFYAQTWKNKKKTILKKSVIFQKMELSSSEIKNFLIFQDMELYSSRIIKVLIFPEMELSSLIFFLHFRKGNFKLEIKKNRFEKISYIFSKKHFLYFQRRNFLYFRKWNFLALRIKIFQS